MLQELFLSIKNKYKVQIGILLYALFIAALIPSTWVLMDTLSGNGPFHIPEVGTCFEITNEENQVFRLEKNDRFSRWWLFRNLETNELVSRMRSDILPMKCPGVK